MKMGHLSPGQWIGYRKVDATMFDTARPRASRLTSSVLLQGVCMAHLVKQDSDHADVGQGIHNAPRAQAR